MDIDRTIRKSPHFTVFNILIAVMVAFAVLLLITVTIRDHSRATVCDRATLGGSPWSQGQGTEGLAGEQTCPQFLEAKAIPCTIVSHNQIAFCIQSPHYRGNNYPNKAPLVFAYRPERGENGELLPIGEFLHDDVTFY